MCTRAYLVPPLKLIFVSVIQDTITGLLLAGIGHINDAGKKNFFVGLPAPGGAITALLPVYLSLRGYVDADLSVPGAVVIALYALVIALLMVSTVPTFSGKTAGKRVPRHWVLPIFVVTVALFGLVFSYPFEALALAAFAYLAAIPFAVVQYRRLGREAAAGITPLPEGP